MYCVLALVTALTAPPAFGPFMTDGHPAVGSATSVPGQGPWEVMAPLAGEVRLKQARASVPRGAGGTNPLYLAYLLYRYFLSPSDGARCQHYPTCSHYGVLATRKHGVLGVLMTIDRLWQAGAPTAVRSYPIVRVHGVPRFYDPVEASDFWFTEEQP